MSGTKTYTMKQSEVKRQWIIVDASELPVGRLSTAVARMLSGKNKPTYTPHIDCGDHVIVINASQLVLSANKNESKEYYSYSGYPSGIKKTTSKELIKENPEKIIRKSIYGMMQKNKLRKGQMMRLKIYKDSDHPHEAQKPLAVKIGDII